MPARARANGAGSIFPYRNGFAAYVWVEKPDGRRGRKWVYGKTREEVHDKWIKLHGQAKAGPVATRSPTVGEYAGYWLREIVKPNLAPGSYVTYEVVVRLYLVPGWAGNASTSCGSATCRPGSTRSGGPASAAPRARTSGGSPPNVAAAPLAAAARICPRQPASPTCEPCSGRCCPRRSPKD